MSDKENTHVTIDVYQVAKEIVEVFHKNGIIYNGMDYVFECVKELVHSNMIAYPSCLSINANPS